MNREFLKGLGLEDDAIDAIMKEHGKTVNSTKEQLDSVTIERDDLKGQLTDRDKQLSDLGKKVKNDEELTAEIERLKGENKTATQDLQAKLDKQAFDFSLEKALTGARVRNPKAAKALLDLESLKLEGDNLQGLEEQLSAIKESDSYLFESDEPSGQEAPGFKVGGDGRSTQTDSFASTLLGK